MKHYFVIIAVLSFTYANSQTLDNITSIQIRHTTLRTNHHIPTLYITYDKNGVTKNEISTLITTDTSTMVSTAKIHFQTLVNFINSNNDHAKVKKDKKSSDVSFRILLFKDEEVISNYSVEDKQEALIYFTKMDNYAISKGMDDNIDKVLKWLISDIENSR